MFDSIMDALGYAGDAVNKPGRAVRGLLSGRLDEGLAAVPFSDSLGITDPARQATGRDMLNSWGADLGDDLPSRLAGFAAEVGTDPLTYAGGGLGRLVGGRATEAAAARSPGYSTSAGDLQRMLSEFSAGSGRMDAALAGRRVENVLTHPNQARLLSEIPEGSSILGAGAEGVAFGTPSGDVLRLGRVLDDAVRGRPVSGDVLQATRGVEVGGGSVPWLAERVPRAKPLSEEAFAAASPSLDSRLAAQGLVLDDAKAANVGLAGGRTQVIDPGAVRVTPGFAGGFQPVTPAAEPGRLMAALLGLLGGQGRTREALAAGLAGPDLRTELMLAGGGLGSVGGAFGRAAGGN